MKMKIEVVLTEIITPSSPTPIDLSNYKLSFLDQMEVPVFSPHTLFYKANTNLTKSEVSSRLKQSLSKTLSFYYPLAGRIVDNNNYVNCKDQGVTYVDAQANCQLFDFLNDEPNNIVLELEKFVPPPPEDNIDVCLVVVQTTFFSCGGVAIGIGASHKIFDGCSVSLFVNTWAAISRGDDDDLRYPILDGATLFPPRDLCGFDPRRWFTPPMSITQERDIIVTKRLRFTSSKINSLRDIYSNLRRATRIEALTAFIWTRFMASTAAAAGGTQTKTKEERVLKLVFPMDIRRRAIPPLSSNLFGNFVQYPITTPLSGEEQGIKVVEKMREAINSIDGDHVNKLRLQEGNQAILNAMIDRQNTYLRGELSTFVFTSLCRFPLYEADFGWSGKPIWFGLGAGGHKHRVAFTDWMVTEGHGSGGAGDGIEAWITLTVEDMEKFEADKELLAYTAT